MAWTFLAVIIFHIQWWFSFSSGLSIHSSPSDTIVFVPEVVGSVLHPTKCYILLWLLNLLSSTFTPNTPKQSSWAIELNSLLKDNYVTMLFPRRDSAGSSLSSPWTAYRLGSRPRNLFCSWTIAGLARRTICNAFQQVMGTSPKHQTTGVAEQTNAYRHFSSII